MSTNLVINQNVNLRNDNCFNNVHNLNNEQIFNYNFTPSVLNNKNDSRSLYIDSSNIPGILQNNNSDISGKNVNVSSELRMGQNLSLEKSKKELDTRLFPGAPYMTGQSVLKNTDLSSKLLYGEETRSSKSVNAIANYSADNFIPLLPSIQQNIQNPDHIIMDGTIRGGMSSRTVIRNIDYMKSCGFKK
jgi:hypothetical protein